MQLTKETNRRYDELKEAMRLFHLGEIDREEMEAALVLWQRGSSYFIWGIY